MPPSPGNSNCDKQRRTLSPAEAPNVAEPELSLVFSVDAAGPGPGNSDCDRSDKANHMLRHRARAGL